MVAQTKADVRSAADKPVPSGKKGVQQAVLVEGKELLDDQAVAAAVVDAEQADAVAVQVAADGGIMPTEAPTQSIGEVAQVTTPTTTDTTTTTTTAPAVEEAAPAMSPWAIGGIALLGVGAIALAVNDDDDDDRPSDPGEDPPPPVPGNVAPTSTSSVLVADPSDATALSEANFPFADTPGDTLSKVRITGITPATIEAADPATAIDPAAGGHGYELITVDAGITWADAQAAAAARGGYLAVLDTEAEMLFIQQQYEGLGDGAIPADGTWVGARQAADQTSPSAGWTWVDGANSELPATSPLWNSFPGVQLPLDDGDNDETDHEAQYAAIFDGLGASEGAGRDPATDTKLLYDIGTDTTTLDKYLIEYNTPNVALTLDGAPVAAGTEVAVGDLGKLSWNSVFNTGGTISYAVADDEGLYSTTDSTLTITAAAPVGQSSIGTMIDDQHLNVLA